MYLICCYIIVTLLNTQRQSQGLPLVGLLNPTLYSNRSAALFNDITSGSNNCCLSHNVSATTCCQAGFSAAVGWDPVTGLGSVTFPSLVMIMQEPVPIPSPRFVRNDYYRIDIDWTVGSTVVSATYWWSVEVYWVSGVYQSPQDMVAKTNNMIIIAPNFGNDNIFDYRAGAANYYGVDGAGIGYYIGSLKANLYYGDALVLYILGNNAPYPVTNFTATPYTIPISTPTAAPTVTPTAAPTAAPTSSPTDTPTAAPTAAPTSSPTVTPTAAPTAAPTSSPTDTPTATPTAAPTSSPTDTPTAAPTAAPTSTPSDTPTKMHTHIHTTKPTHIHTTNPTHIHTANPTHIHTTKPTHVHTANPTHIHTTKPTHIHTTNPTHIHTTNPTHIHTTNPTHIHTTKPTHVHTTKPIHTHQSPICTTTTEAV